HSLARALRREPLDHLARVRLEPVVLDREVEHLADHRERAVRHDGRALSNLVENRANITACDVLDLHRAPTLDERLVRPFARPLLVRRAAQETDVLSTAALLAGVALDVLVRKFGKRLRAALLGFDRRGIRSLLQ